jgi:predicted metal-dependent peptidase
MNDDLTAEIYYRHLPSIESHAADCGSGAGGKRLADELGDDEEHPGVSGVEAAIIKKRVATEVTRYARHGHDSVPGELLRWAEEQLTPTIDWRQVLAGEIRGSVATASDATDYSFQRFSRRAAAFPDVRFAGRLRHLPQVAVVVDTSGSMAPEMIRRVVTEVEGLLQSCGVADDAVTFILVDSEVSLCQRISRLPETLPVNRGGTDMTVGIARALEASVRPDVIIVLTDGYTDWPPAPIRGVSVIAGLIRPPEHFGSEFPPRWISTVKIPFE